MRPVLALLVAVLVAGCAGARSPAASRAAVLARPGDSARARILAERTGERPPATAPDPLPRLTQGELAASPALLAPTAPADAKGEARRAASYPARFGPWRLTGRGDAVMPLQNDWNLRVGLAAGTPPSETFVPGAGPRPDVYLVPGLRVEHDL